MDWSNERYVRVYTRDTTDWLLLSWEARSLWLLMLRKFDRAGVLDVGSHGARGLAVTVGMPLDVVERALPELIDDGCVQWGMDGRWLVARNFRPAQEAEQSDKHRKAESRARRREIALAQGASEEEARRIARPDRYKAAGHKSGPAGPGHGPEGPLNAPAGHNGSQRVTAGHSEPSRAEPNVTEPSQPDRARACVEPDRPTRDDTGRGRDAFLALADEIWAEQEAVCAEVRRAGVEGRALGPMHPAKAELVRRISERAGDGRGLEAAAADCRHVLRVLVAEAKRKRTLRWLDGRHWGLERFSAALVRGVNEADAPRTSAARAPQVGYSLEDEEPILARGQR